MSTIPQSNQQSGSLPSNQRSEWLSCVSIGFLYYYLTSMMVIVAAVLGHDLILPTKFPLSKPEDALHGFANWDGEWYLRIARDGYDYDPSQPSSVAFFPAYPLLARGVSRVLGVDLVVSLLIVSHASLIAAFALTLAYIRLRFPDDGRNVGEFALLSLGLFPTALFFRMAYSESLFVFLTVLCLYGIERRWPLLLVAVLVGFATAARPVGIALVPPFLFYIWRHSLSARQFGIRLAWSLPLSLWGLLAYMGYQWLAFAEPLAFFKTQADWRVYRPSSVSEKVVALVTFKPLWSAFTPSSGRYWLRHTWYPNPFASLSLMNPVLFAAAIVVLAIGLRRRWLSIYEALLAFFLLLIPYVATSYELYMASMGRFVAAIFPLHLVLGQILARLRGPLAALLLSVSAALLTLYAALFAAWYQFY